MSHPRSNFVFPLENNQEWHSINSFHVASDILKWISSLQQSRVDDIILSGLHELVIRLEDPRGFQCTVDEMAEILPINRDRVWFQLGEFAQRDSALDFKEKLRGFLLSHSLIECRWYKLYLRAVDGDQFKLIVDENEF